jgi:uncharacterized protein YdeI (YjbR/CyaY-like superfamily)
VGIQDDAEHIHAETREEWRAWLAANHDRPDGVWLVWWKGPTGRPAPSYDEAVEEALCFGWIDSTKRSLDEDRLMQWYSPRRKGSGWSRPNKVRLERITAAGTMAPAGQRALDAAMADGSWTLLDEVEDRIVPPDLAAAFDAHPGAREHWDAFTASQQKMVLTWIVTAKRPATRQQRVDDTAAAAAAGRPSRP